MQETTTAAVPETELPVAGLTVPDLSIAELSLDDLDDAELLALARRDHDEAYAALFTRHSYAAHRLARHLGHREEAEDIVAESFAQVLDLFRRGKGPERAFRAYLFTTVRHEAGRRAKARQRVMPTDDERQIDSIVPFGGGHLEEFEQAAIRGAYESLPARWRTVLWHLDVEGRKPQELGPMLKLTPNSVSALAYRARSALREAYLRQHINHEGPAASARLSRGSRQSLGVCAAYGAGSRAGPGPHAPRDLRGVCGDPRGPAGGQPTGRDDRRVGRRCGVAPRARGRRRCQRLDLVERARRWRSARPSSPCWRRLRQLPPSPPQRSSG